MQKPLLKNLQNDIDNLLDHVETDQFSRETLQSQVIHVLTETYNALNKLDESRIENDHLDRLENNISSTQKYIDMYQALLDKEKKKEDQDDNLIFRHTYSKHIYESFLKNQEKALAELRIPIASNFLYEYDEYRKEYENFISSVDPKMLSFTQRNYANKDLFLNLYKRLEGYEITHDKIIKSAGLKIFSFFNVVTKVQKTKLATHIEFIFSSLGETTLSIDPKRASSIKIIGEFNGFILFDYLGNKKGGLFYFGFNEAFNKALDAITFIYKVQNNPAEVRRINNNRQAIEAALLAHLLT
jgi:hypothetical protein